MIRKAILISSNLLCVSAVVWNSSLGLSDNRWGSTFWLAAMIVFWLLSVILVYKHTEKRPEIRTRWVLLTMFTGWMGGVLYAVYGYSLKEDSKAQVDGFRSDNLKNAAIFNFVIGGILFLASLISIRSINILTIILLALASLFLFIGNYLWKK